MFECTTFKTAWTYPVLWNSVTMSVGSFHPFMDFSNYSLISYSYGLWRRTQQSHGYGGFRGAYHQQDQSIKPDVWLILCKIFYRYNDKTHELSRQERSRKKLYISRLLGSVCQDVVTKNTEIGANEGSMKDTSEGFGTPMGATTNKIWLETEILTCLRDFKRLGGVQGYQVKDFYFVVLLVYIDDERKITTSSATYTQLFIVK